MFFYPGMSKKKKRYNFGIDKTSFYYRYLKSFLSRFDELTPDERIERLIHASNVVVRFTSNKDRKINRTMFNNFSKYRKRKNCSCCFGKPEVRHHIIALINGGTNHEINLITLCKHCHSIIHPFMKYVNAPKLHELSWIE